MCKNTCESQYWSLPCDSVGNTHIMAALML